MKKIKILGLACLLVLCAGCQDKKEYNASIDQKSDFQFGLSVANSEDGTYMIAKKRMDSEDKRIVYFYDKQSDNIVPLCQKVNCEHHDMTCSAFQLGTMIDDKQVFMLFSIIFYNERLYLSYIGITGNTPVLINSIAKDGSDLRKEYASSDLGMINVFCMYKGNFIISKGFFDKNEVGDVTSSSTINAIQMYDPATKKETMIANEEKLSNRMVYPIGLEKQTLYYTNIQMDTNTFEILAYHMESKETTTIAKSDGAASVAYQGDAYYVKDKKTVIKQNMKTGESATFLELDYPHLKWMVSPQGYAEYSFLEKEQDYLSQVINLDSKEPLFDEFQKNVYIIGRSQDYYFLQGDDRRIMKYDERKKKMTVLVKE